MIELSNGAAYEIKPLSFTEDDHEFWKKLVKIEEEAEEHPEDMPPIIKKGIMMALERAGVKDPEAEASLLNVSDLRKMIPAFAGQSEGN